MAPAPKAPAHRLGCATPLPAHSPAPPCPGRGVRACWRPLALLMACWRQPSPDSRCRRFTLHLIIFRSALYTALFSKQFSKQPHSSHQPRAACSLQQPAHLRARGRESCFGFPFNTSPSAATRGLRMTDHPYLSAPQACTPLPPATAPRLSTLHTAPHSAVQTPQPQRHCSAHSSAPAMKKQSSLYRNHVMDKHVPESHEL